jgi:glutaconate CoA-transferase subunit A
MLHSNKLMSLREAIKNFVNDGDHLSLGGATANRIPVGAVYEIIRQRKKNLHLYGHILGVGPDLLIGAGCVRAIEGAYLGIGRFEPTCIRFRKAVERKEIFFEDYSNYQMALRFLAGSMGIPYIVTRSGLGSDIINQWGFDESFRRNNTRIALKKLVIQDNPFSRQSNEKVVLLPAINPDVTILHVQKTDKEGTVRIEGLSFADIEQAKAAKHLIVTTEEIVELEYLKLQPELNHIPSFFVNAIVLLPYGAHPTQCFNYYDYDVAFLNMIKEVSEEDEKFAHFLNEYVHGVNDHAEYLENIGIGRIQSLRSEKPFGYRPGIDRAGK